MAHCAGAGAAAQPTPTKRNASNYEYYIFTIWTIKSVDSFSSDS